MTVDEGDGYMVTVREDWFHPPVDERCECQKETLCQPCKCGLGAEPSGVCMRYVYDTKGLNIKCSLID